MRKPLYLFIAVVALIIAGCKGSDTYRGTWKAMDAVGAKSTLHFEDTTVTVIDSTGKTEKIGYKQNSVNLENHKETYGITLSNGNSFKIVFPNKKGEHVGFIANKDDQLIYSLGREEYVTYEQVYHTMK